MRRDTFLTTLLTLGSGIGLGGLPLHAMATHNTLHMMIPANPGGGWDLTARALGRTMQAADLVQAVTYENQTGATGARGLHTFVQSTKSNPNALLMMGSAMVSGLLSQPHSIDLSHATPIASLISEYNVFVLPSNSPFQTMADVLAQLRKDPASIKWGGGSRGAPEHMACAMLAQAAGVDPAKINYVAFRGGGEAAAAILGGHMTVGGSGLSEFSEAIASGKVRAIAVTSERRLPGKDSHIPTLKEQGLDVVIGNWRGVYAPANLTPRQRQALISLIERAVQTPAWQAELKQHGWNPLLLTGDAFGKFVDSESARLRDLMGKVGMLSR